jgi:hypothetical protein
MALETSARIDQRVLEKMVERLSPSSARKAEMDSRET